MSWEREKSTVSKKPEEPSFVLWLMLGVIAVVGSVVLFVLHVNKLSGPLQEFNIWVVTASPIVIWFFFLCLRGWLFNSAFDKHEFEANEADYAQQQWTEWAGRNIAVLHSSVIFPEALTPFRFLQASAEQVQRTTLTQHFYHSTPENCFSQLLKCVSDALVWVPSDLPLGATLLTDWQEDPLILQAEFAKVWQEIVPLCPAPVLNIQTANTFIWLEERIKSPTLDVDLILVHQTQGKGRYSDILASLLLTSNDVATKYQLTHDACLLRPMSLDMGDMNKSLDTFFSTQTQACATASIVGDNVEWGNAFSGLLEAAQSYGGHWKPEQLHWLEKYAGLSGPFSPWIMAAVASDIVNIQKADCLMLSTDGERKFINTVKTGNRDNDNR
ncbi:hypothetical protein ACOGYG_001890 [Edwardsiella piscicida]|uniref:hypothetical protein n=1 Tax=Edwardsiella piscicida TaxID=1263550 RepID=UPI0002C1200C|nr:hypothetical protein [Edwardsiella piscicida]AGH73996.1 hypothetical protein ETAC_09375 [Edwardsiella piscicida C07-087]EKS7780371.1 hypothetical protein [Edwardsiella piscicida]EKS7783412.1 hypothetical protein [Edwardsiella piscicida]UCQ23033.1 hypothetical protein DCE91_09510 [Edwardsiella piscicida]UCQ33239.1 hypothetical protein DCF34_09500 [Edwardsiella piscicida]